MTLKNNIITFSLYFFSTYAVVQLMHDPTQAILVWPAAGVGIVTALVWGYKVIPGLYLAQIGVSLLLFINSKEDFTLNQFFISNLFVAGGMFRCYFGAFLIKYFVGYPNSLVSFKSILKFFFIAAPLAILASTIVFALIKYSLGFLNTASFIGNTLDWWFGDFLGFMIFAPIALIFTSQPKSIWKARFLTVGLPIVFILLSIIIIYNKYQILDSKKVVENLQTTNDLIASKLEIHYKWFQELTNNINYHMILKGNYEQKIDAFLKSLENSNTGASVIAWEYQENNNYVKVSTKFSQISFSEIRKLSLEKLFSQYFSPSRKIFSTMYLKEIKEFVNIYTFKYLGKPPLKIYIFHNIKEQISALIEDYKLFNTNFLINTNVGDDLILLNKKQTLTPKEKITIKSNFNMNNDTWNIIIEPSARFLFQSNSNLSSILAKIGLLFAGLIGVMLLIITGKSTINDIMVKERTIDLDLETKELKNQKEQYQELIEQHPVILWRQNLTSSKMSYISSKVEKLFGYPIKQWLKEENFWMNHIHKEDIKNVTHIIRKSIVNQTSFQLEYRFIKSDMSIAWINDVVNIDIDSEYNRLLVGLMIDVSDIYKAEKLINISESKYRTLFKHAVDSLVIIGLGDKHFKDSNDNAKVLFGLGKINNKNLSLTSLTPKIQPNGKPSIDILEEAFSKLVSKKQLSLELTMNNSNKQEILCQIELVNLPEQTEKLVLVNINDITEKKSRERRINQLAYYDNLTKLPNREYFYSKFKFFHKHAVEKNKFGTIIYLDLDRFKLLNDSLGHHAGDELLKMVASRIKKASKKKDFCARLGGDEFVILSKNLKNTIETSLETSLVAAELILESLNQPYQLKNYEHYITPSIGISVFPHKQKSLDQIIHQADIAMYASKEKGKNTITIYQENMVKQVGERLKIEKAIRQAFDEQEFELYYQPKYNLDRVITSVEALLRWDKLQELNLNTENLIELIEEIGLIHELGYWVFDSACAQLEEWQKQNFNIKSIAINISSIQFHQTLFIEQIMSVINSYNISPSQIVLELTEAVLIKDTGGLTKKLSEIQDFGVKISLDDFGTGYSSLAYLKQLPIDELKIDKMFIEGLTSDVSSQHIIQTIINLAKLENLELVAEGIETQEQFTLLKSLGCKSFQGYYFSKPLPNKSISRLLQTFV